MSCPIIVDQNNGKTAMRGADAFGETDIPEPVDLAPLHAKVGQPALENEFLEGALTVFDHPVVRSRIR